MLDVKQLMLYVIRPTLKHLDLHSKAAEQLVLGTGLVESKLTYLHQLGEGPACGIYQMEPFTHDDLYKTILTNRPKIKEKVNSLGMVSGDMPGSAAEEMIGNLFYATAMCRVHYLRVKADLPAEDDILGMANYWKKYYNTVHGKGRIEDFMRYKELILTTTKG